MTMRPGELGWIVCLAGLPWSYFIIRLIEPFKTLDIWHANTWWMQGWVLVLAGIHAGARHRLGEIPSALWWLVLWPTLSILWVFTLQLTPGQPYPMAMLAGVGNLWIILLALLLMTSWSPHTLQIMLRALFWSGVGLIGYGWLQAINLDQFFRFIDGSVKVDTVVGVLGNPTHFACLLALWTPLALIQPGWSKVWIVPAYGLLLLASSATALFTAVLLALSYDWRCLRPWWKRWVGVPACGLLLFAGGSVFNPAWASWSNLHGRLETWQAWWDIIVQRPILGWGLGFTKQMAQQLSPSHALYGWKHLHNEYYQWWGETGIIGLVLLGWAGWSLWQRRPQGEQTPERWACGAMLIGCCFIACLNFSWHLWQMGMFGLVGLAGWLIMTEESHASHAG